MKGLLIATSLGENVNSNVIEHGALHKNVAKYYVRKWIIEISENLFYVELSSLLIFWL